MQNLTDEQLNEISQLSYEEKIKYIHKVEKQLFNNYLKKHKVECITNLLVQIIGIILALYGFFISKNVSDVLAGTMFILVGAFNNKILQLNYKIEYESKNINQLLLWIKSISDSFNKAIDEFNDFVEGFNQSNIGNEIEDNK